VWCAEYQGSRGHHVAGPASTEKGQCYSALFFTPALRPCGFEPGGLPPRQPEVKLDVAWGMGTWVLDRGQRRFSYWPSRPSP
jgi:hypothetical protein